MTGKYDIEIYNNKVHYFLTIKRNITVLQGNSATGKTELIRLLQEHEENGISSGITLISEARCTVLGSVDWEIRLSALRNTIIFIDENNHFMYTRKFSEYVKESDNYFVLIARDDLSQLPYSIEEIYGLRNVSSSQKYKSYKRIYNEMYKLYNMDLGKRLIPQTVITEDSNSGYEFYCILYPEKCISAGGKGNVYRMIREHMDNSILAVVDGAAFGAEIGRVMRYLKANELECVLYAPESFEYLILKSGLIDVPDDVLNETYRYADSQKYMSWEMFFTAYLADATRNSIFQYSKARLAEVYKTKGSVNRIAAQIPEQIQETKLYPFDRGKEEG